MMNQTTTKSWKITERETVKVQLFISFDSPPCVEEDFGLKLSSGKLASKRHMA